MGMASLTVMLPDGTLVKLFPDGHVQVYLATMRVSRHELMGSVIFSPDGTAVPVGVEDAFICTPLKPHVIRAAVNAARVKARFARRVARQIARTTSPVRWYEPGTLAHLVALAEGKIREDGWPAGHIPL